MMKRIFALVLAFVMLAGMVPVRSFAEDGNVEPKPTETPAIVAEETCATCGQANCESDHTAWCATCKKDDCGKEHKACDKCATVDCTADHSNWCDTCKKDDCGVDHTVKETEAPTTAATEPVCATCGQADCESDHAAWCAACKKDDCGIDHSAQQPRIPVTSTGPKKGALVDKLVKFNTTYVYVWDDVENPYSAVPVAASAFPATMRAVESQTTSTLLYKLESADDTPWPEEYADNVWVEEKYLEEVKEPCATCGKTDCTSDHLTWCATCKKDDCGKEHKACDKCATVDCTADHSNWCATCKKDNCGVAEHGVIWIPTFDPAPSTMLLCSYCDATRDETGVIAHEDNCNTNFYVDASGDMEKVAAFSNVCTPALYTNEKPSEGFDYENGLLEAEYDYDNAPLVKVIDYHWEVSGPVLWYRVAALDGETLPDGITTESWILQKYTNEDNTANLLYFVDVSILGKTVAFNTTTAVLYDGIDGERMEVDVTLVPYMDVQDLSTDGSTTWYYVDGDNWPEAYADYHYIPATSVKIAEKPKDKPVTVEKTTESGINVAVEGILPKGTSLSVQDVDIDIEAFDIEAFDIEDENDILAAVDIKLLFSNGAEYQPYTDDEKVMVSLDAKEMDLADGDTVRLHHMHEGEVTVYEPIIVIGGKLTFWTDRFSIYVVSNTLVENKTTEITENSTYDIRVGDTVVFWGDYPGSRAVWQVTDESNAIEYELVPKESGNTSWVQWIKVTAKDVGTVTLSFTVTSEWFWSDTTQHSFTLNVLPPEGTQPGKSDLYIDDNVAESGCLVPAWTDGEPWNVTYTWTRSDQVAVREEALNTNGSVNISIDRGGVTNKRKPIKYTVTASDKNGTVLDTATFEVTYGNEILNASFEKPGGFSGHKAFYNGYSELYWKTTAPGTGDQLLMDIELGYGPYNPYGVGEAADGYYFAELNAENFGALYQDILTTPGSDLTWGFSHTKRAGTGETNEMYVIVAPTQYAHSILSRSDIEALLAEAKTQARNKRATIPENQNSNSPGFEFTYQGGTYRIWKSVARTTANTADEWNQLSGTYRVPQGQYLTRLFFASEPSGTSSTVGNLIDYTSAGEYMQYRVMYYKDNEEVAADTISGRANAYNTINLITDKHDLDDYLKQYSYPAKILVNGRTYPGTIENLKMGLYITDYGTKINGTDKYEEDVVLQIYFQVPNIIVTKVIEIEGWATMSAKDRKELIGDGLTATFALFDGTTQVVTTDVTITQVSALGTLTAMASFPMETIQYGRTYRIEEIAPPQLDGYELVTEYTKQSVCVNNDDPATEEKETVDTVTVTNQYYARGSLEVTKHITKEFQDDIDLSLDVLTKSFDFTVQINEQKTGAVYTYTKYVQPANATQEQLLTTNLSFTDTETGTLLLGTDNKLSFTLKHGERIVINNLPIGSCVIEETQEDGFLAPQFDKTSYSVPSGGTEEAICTNTTRRTTGTLIISKTVVNENNVQNVIPSEGFGFTVALSDYSGTTIPVKYSHTDAVQNVSVTTDDLGDKIFRIYLKHGENAMISDIPATGYFITEDPYENFGTAWADGSNYSVIRNGETKIAACTNTYGVNTGDLRITKEVRKQSDTDTVPDDTYVIRVNLKKNGAALTGSYPYFIYNENVTPTADNHVGTGYLSSGGTISLKQGQFVIIKSIPACDYEVQETNVKNSSTNDYRLSDHYDVSYDYGSRTITAGSEAKVKVINTYKRHLAELTIAKTGTQAVDENQSFIFRVQCTKPSFGVAVDMTVVITGNSSVTLTDLPVGVYTITEQSGWSWRYNFVSATGAKVQSTTGSAITVNVDGTAGNTVTVTNNRNLIYWLNGAAAKVNIFDGSAY